MSGEQFNIVLKAVYNGISLGGAVVRVANATSGKMFESVISDASKSMGNDNIQQGESNSSNPKKSEESSGD